MELPKQPKVRQSPRYNLPLYAILAVGEREIKTSVVNIANGGCLLQGESGVIAGYTGEKCNMSFKLAEEYPESVKQMLPSDPVGGTILMARLPEKDLKKCVWMVEFNNPEGEEFVGKLADKLHRRPLLTWLCPDYEEQIVDFVERYGMDCSQLSRGRLDRWLVEIRDKELRDLALELLGVAISRYFYSYEKCLEFAKELWAKILDLDGVNHNLERVRLFALGPPAKSGHLSLYTMRLANNLAKGICEEDPTPMDKKELENVEWLIFLDDFIGSGNTANGQLQWFEKKLPKVDGKPFYNKKVALGCFVGFKEEAKSNFEYLKNFPILVVRELNKEADTIHSHTIVPVEKKEALTKLCNLAEKRKLYCDRKGKPWPRGYKDLGALVSFYKNTPTNSLPILWSKEDHWQPPLPRYQVSHWKSLDPPKPSNIMYNESENRKKINKKHKVTLLVEEIKKLLDSFGRVIICGDTGIGKTDLAACVAEDLKLSRNIIWHEFANYCSVDSFFCHLGHFLAERCYLSELQEKLLRGEPETELLKALTKSLNQLKPVLFLGGIDRIKHDSLQALLHKLISRLDPKVIQVVCTFRTSTGRGPGWLTHNFNSWTNVTVKMRSDNDIRGIIHRVLDGNSGTIKPECEKRIIDLAHGHPLVAWLLASLYRKGGEDAIMRLRWKPLPKKDSASVLESATHAFFKLLDKDLQFLLLAASVFVCPFEREQLEAMYENKSVLSCHKIDKHEKSVGECLGLLHEWCVPFLIDVEGNRFEMPRPIQECIHTIFDKAGRKADWRNYEIKAGQLFATLETQEVGHRLDSIAIAHHHFVSAKKLNEATQVLLDQREVFTSNGRSERLLDLVEAIPHLELREKQIREDLVYLRARLLRRLTRHAALRKLCEEELGRLSQRKKLKRAQYYYLEAVVNGSMRDFKNAWRCFTKAAEEIEKKKKRTEKEEEFLIKLYLRRCQTRMSEGNYLEAWRELEKVVAKLGENKKLLFRHELAMACRHMYTLLYMNGEYIEALGWAEDALLLNDRLNDYEGVAIMHYKLARAWLALKETERAADLCSEARNTLEAHVSGGRWWKMAFLETQAGSAIAASWNKDKTEKSRLLKEAEGYLSEAEQMLNEMTEAKKRTVRPHLSEILQAEAQLAFAQGRKWKCKWWGALKYLYPKDADIRVNVTHAIENIKDRFRLSGLLYDKAYFHFNNGKIKHKGVQKIVIPLLRDCANILREALLECSQIKPLELMAEVSHNFKGEELAEVEPLYRILAINVRDDIVASGIIRRTAGPLKKLLERQGEDTRGIRGRPKGMSDIDDIRKKVENALSDLLKSQQNI